MADPTYEHSDLAGHQLHVPFTYVTHTTPVGMVEGDTWLDTTVNAAGFLPLSRYNGSAWVEIVPSVLQLLTAVEGDINSISDVITLADDPGGDGLQIGLSTEALMDLIGPLFTATGLVTVTYNDTDGTIDFAAPNNAVAAIVEDVVIAGAGISVTADVDAGTVTIAQDTSAFGEFARDALGTALVAGSGITITVNDGADTITVASSITQYTNENAQDTIAAMLAAGSHTGITVTYNDGANSMSLASTITQYTAENARDDVGAALVGGTGITVTVNDGADTITIAGTVTQYTDELAQDAVAAMLVAGTNVTLTYNDGSNTLTIDATGGGGSIATLSDVSLTGLADGNVLVYHSSDSTWKPGTPASGYTAENARDDVGAALVGGTGITVTLNDGADTITIAGTVTQYTDEMAQDTVAAMLAAGSHTGITVGYNDGSNSMSLTNTITQYTDELAQDAVASMIAGGTKTGITITYNDASNTMDFVVSGGSSYTAENARDDVGAALQSGANISVVVDDAGDTITIGVSPSLTGISLLTMTEVSALGSTPSGNTITVQAEDSGGLTRIRVYDDQGHKFTLLRDNIFLVYNATGSTIAKGSAVYITGMNSGTPQVTKAKADAISTATVDGFMTMDVTTGNYGFMQRSGAHTNFDTSSFAANDVLYLSAATAGAVTTTAPAYPNYTVKLGRVQTVGSAATVHLAIVAPTRDSFYTIEVIIGGAGAVLTTGVKAYLRADQAGTIVAATTIGDQVGSISAEVWKTNKAVPSSGNKISSSAPMTLTAAQYVEDTTLTGWSVTVVQGDVFAFNIIGTPATTTQVTLALTIKRAA